MEERRITLKFEGPSISAEGVAFDDLVDVFLHLQTAVRRMAEFHALKSNSPTMMRDIFKDAGTLKLRAAREGSLIADIELAYPPRLVDYGPDALDEVIKGIEDPYNLLPPAVAREIAAIPESLKSGTSQLTITGGRAQRTAVLKSDIRFEQPIELEPPPEQIRMVGRLLEVDWNRGSAELHSPSGIIALQFGKLDSDVMQELARQHVSVYGIATVSRSGKITKLKIESIAAASDDSRFWQPNLHDDIQEQQIQPFHSDSALALDDKTDADEFLAAIFGE